MICNELGRGFLMIRSSIIPAFYVASRLLQNRLYLEHLCDPISANQNLDWRLIRPFWSMFWNYLTSEAIKATARRLTTQNLKLY